jgi:hypothetical protein
MVNTWPPRVVKQYGLPLSSWVIGAQVEPGVERGMLIVGRVVGELDA